MRHTRIWSLSNYKNTLTFAKVGLGRRADRDYTPAGIVSRMWNHAPTMWAAMRQGNITPPAVSDAQAADLFAFFYATRYFERLADAGRGKHLFEEKHCADCHALKEGGKGPGKPVAQWESISYPVALAAEMWVHAPRMEAAMKLHKYKWPELTPQDLADIMIFVENLPETRGPEATFVIGPLETGAEFFKTKGCVNCHTGAKSLERLHDLTLTDIAAALWNHTPLMKQPEDITTAEMRQIIAYVWVKQFFYPEGSAEHGKRLFEQKHCASCHDNPSSGAPSLNGTGPYSSIHMVSVLWKHGPTMLSRMTQANVTWPTFTPKEMSDLIAYLDTRK